jgi:hypothetical protein
MYISSSQSNPINGATNGASELCIRAAQHCHLLLDPVINYGGEVDGIYNQRRWRWCLWWNISQTGLHVRAVEEEEEEG